MSKKKRNQDTPKSKAAAAWENYKPDGNFYIAPERMNKFTWEEGDLVQVRPARRKKRPPQKNNRL